MRPSQTCRVLLLAEGAYRALLLVYPADHRWEYGPLMVQSFRDRCRDVRRQKGNWGLVRLWWRVLKDTLVTAVVEHLDELEERSRRMTKRQQTLVAVCALGPLVLWIGLLIINPAFTSRVLINPLGWPIVMAVFLLLSLGYILQRGVLAHSSQTGLTHLLVRRPALRAAFLVGTIVLLVLPAVALIIFGPAIVTLLTMMGQ